MYEVELKFPLPSGPAAEAVLKNLANLGATFGEPATQEDAYFNHPVRDFAETDEALRVRVVTGADGVPHGRLTYKGPKVDATTKTREEFEPCLAAGPEEPEAMKEALRRLGFREVFTVTKTRRTATVVSPGDRSFEIARDRVDGLGEYLEVETEADQASLESARTELLALAKSLGLTNSERRSYLALLLEASTPTPSGGEKR